MSTALPICAVRRFAPKAQNPVLLKIEPASAIDCAVIRSIRKLAEAGRELG